MVNSKLIKSYFFLLAGLFLNHLSTAQRLEKLWISDTVLRVPESVLYDQKNERLFVSNIDGKSVWEKDKKGSISLLTPSGKVLNAQWIKGLHAPKGMGMYQDLLIVADVDSVVFIETTKATIIKKVHVVGAKELNDITLDKRGNVYVSDSKTNKIHMIGLAKLDVSEYLDGLNNPNGITFSDKTFYYVDAEGLHRLGKNKEKQLVASGFQGYPDGIESIDEETFFVSCWSGEVWVVKSNGEKKLLLDTKPEMINAADIGFNKKSNTLYVPNFWKNQVTAYQLIK